MTQFVNCSSNSSSSQFKNDIWVNGWVKGDPARFRAWDVKLVR
jgi:hypothetical protein